MRTMVSALIVWLLAAGWLPAQNQAWADKLFKGDTSHDFGTVARGAQLYHRFPITNIWAVPLEIMNVRVSCGCVTATATKQTLQPRETGYLDVNMDARKFTGPKNVTIFVTVGPQYMSTATVHVSAVSRADVVFNPGEVNFGIVPCGQKATQMVDVEYAGALDWKVSDVIKNGAPLDVDLDPLYREPGRVGYRIRTTLKPEAPPGLLRCEVQLKTNDPASPLVPLLVEANVQASLSVAPASVSFDAKVGEVLVKRVMVRAGRPFRIVGVEGLGDGIEADIPPAAATTQWLTLRYRATTAGDNRRELRIVTDLDKQASATLAVQATSAP